MNGQANMADGIVRVEDLTHRYTERVALDGVSFEVFAGEVFGLLGPNGGGKSTLFRILSTQLAPSVGAARVFGFDVARQPSEVRRRIGVVFQSQSVDGKLTVEENLRHQGHLYGLRGASLKARIEEMLARFGLAERARERVEKLSGGLRRRVEISKAMLHRPALLLLDEPTTGLDIGARHDLWDYLLSLRAGGDVTIMLTTHTMEEAERCERILLLDEGKAIALDTPTALKAEIGGDVVTAQAREPATLQEKIHARFGGSPTVVGQTVRIERERGHEFITQLIEAFPGEIDAVTLSKPTLEDVFIQRTGHQFVEQPRQ
jgi:ABC-2 type transport system ATP-binding protein